MKKEIETYYTNIPNVDMTDISDMLTYFVKYKCEI